MTSIRSQSGTPQRGKFDSNEARVGRSFQILKIDETGKKGGMEG